MKSFKAKRPSKEHIKKMLSKAKLVNKNQLELLGRNKNLLASIEAPFSYKNTLAYNIIDFDKSKK